ncbi:MAG: hypothetical protein MK135_01100 [Polyangiaceae bacterium]|nr:hypothetical protein [Polyangiaceae bacterium]
MSVMDPAPSLSLFSTLLLVSFGCQTNSSTSQKQESANQVEAPSTAPAGGLSTGKELKPSANSPEDAAAKTAKSSASSVAIEGGTEVKKLTLPTPTPAADRAEEPVPGKELVGFDRSPDLALSVASYQEKKVAECVDIELWGDVQLRRFEIAAWESVLAPPSSPQSRRLKTSCSEEFPQGSPRSVCDGSGFVERDGRKYKVSIRTQHYWEKDLPARRKECAARKGRWIAF